MQKCEKREKMMQEIGKEIKDYSEAEAKQLMTHFKNCLVCRGETKQATELIVQYLLSGEGADLRPLAKILQFKPPEKGKNKRPK